ncbi:phage tail protein [Photobacterium leiognathi]|uniref:phage tail protein n=1 Tax=Photobacterium leiognathi TaxID=553611 RepID=UPI002738BC2D|nr:phage tail protein [Photobacterium leiognathi]
MAVTQQLRTVVTLGGAVDSSFSQMSGTVSKELGKATKTVKSLEREQQKLTKQIKKAKLAGADVSLLTRRYDELGREIEQATRSATGFEAANDFGSTLRAGATHAAAATGAVVGLTGALGGLVAMTNANTAEQNGLAKAYGMSIEQYRAWGGIAQQAGLNAENTGDLVEELTNKFGEFKAMGEQSALSDVFGKLGLTKAMLEGKTAAEQFEIVMRRLERVGDKQQAASMADMLMGGEGNKLITFLRQSGESIEDLLAKQEKINNLTQRGADGALAYNTAWQGTLGAVSSSWAEVAGIVGEQFAPQLTELSSKISGYFRANKAAIIDFAVGAVSSLMNVTVSLIDVATTVNDVVQAFGGWQTVGAIIAGLMAGKMVAGVASLVGGVVTMINTLRTAQTVMLGLNAVMMANPIGLVTAAVAGLVTAGILLYQNWDKVTQWFAGKLEWFKTAFPDAFNTIQSVLSWSPMDAIEQHWNAMPQYFSSMWQSVTGIFDRYIGKVKATWETVKGFVNDLKFWQDDDESSAKTPTTRTPQAPQSAPTYTSANSYAQRAIAANATTAPATKGNTTTIHQTVDKIEIITPQGADNKAIGREVADRLSGERNSAMYDTTASD